MLHLKDCANEGDGSFPSSFGSSPPYTHTSATLCLKVLQMYTFWLYPGACAGVYFPSCKSSNFVVRSVVFTSMDFGNLSPDTQSYCAQSGERCLQDTDLDTTAFSEMPDSLKLLSFCQQETVRLLDLSSARGKHSLSFSNRIRYHLGLGSPINTLLFNLS